MLHSSNRMPSKEKGLGAPSQSVDMRAQQHVSNRNESHTQLMDVRGVAAYLNLDRQTIYNWLHQQKIAGIKVGGVWRFDRRVIEEWLQARTVGNGIPMSHQARKHLAAPPEE